MTKLETGRTARGFPTALPSSSTVTEPPHFMEARGTQYKDYISLPPSPWGVVPVCALACEKETE